jgi:hypothetical protein
VTAEEIIEEAREIHPAFTEQQNPDTTLLRFLNRYQDRLRGKVKLRNPSVLAVELEISLPLPDFTKGKALPLYDLLLVGEAHARQDSRADFFIVPYEKRIDPDLWPSGYVRGQTLYLTAVPDAWSDFTRILLPYVPVAQPLTDLDSEFSLPPTARNALVDNLALFMATRTRNAEGMPALDRDRIRQDAVASEQEFLSRVGQHAVTISYTREVW